MRSTRRSSQGWQGAHNPKVVGSNPTPASVLDLGSRLLLGYSMAEHMRTELVLDALGMAVAARGGDEAVAGVIAHADRGSQYTSNDYVDFCHEHKMRPSAGAVGVCWDINALAESFIGLYKTELIRRQQPVAEPRRCR